MTPYDYDLFVIGAGSGGVRTSRFAAALGARVAVAEERYLGGTCVNVGCIPKKLFSYAAHDGEDIGHAEGYGWRAAGRAFDWRTLVANKDREIERLNGVYEKLLSGAGVTLFRGRAGLIDAHTVEAGGLGLENAGVNLSASGAVVVGINFQSNVPSIYAVADVIDRVLLTPVALAEGMVVAENLFGAGGRTLDYEGIPTAIFSNPNIGTVGLSEARARERAGGIDVYRTTFGALRHQLIGSGEKVLMKLVVDRASDRVLGVHMAGPDAGEIIQGFRRRAQMRRNQTPI
jgi:pyruvate/2-oxoglutarate dehydrogenase complex dihydrolipoamide dehydrogenase (E3) component